MSDALQTALTALQAQVTAGNVTTSQLLTTAQLLLSTADSQNGSRVNRRVGLFTTPASGNAALTGSTPPTITLADIARLFSECQTSANLLGLCRTAYQDAQIAVASSNGLTFTPMTQLIALANNIISLGNQVETEETATLLN
jgi:hypothetical protein